MLLQCRFTAFEKPFYGFDALTSAILRCNLTLITLLSASDGIVK